MQDVYWLRMNGQIEEVISMCQECQENKKKQQQESLMQTELPSRPLELIATYVLYYCSKKLASLHRYYSDFIEVGPHTENTYSTIVIEKLARIFTVHSRPNKLIPDNDQQFRSQQFHQFIEDRNISHESRRLHHHRASGKVERANQT